MVEPFREQVRSRPAAQQDIRIDPSAANAGAVGRGLQGVAQGLGEAAKVVEARQTLTAENDARAALNELMARDRDLRFNPETGFLVQTGANAVGRRGSYVAAWREARDDIGRHLSPAARRVFGERADALQNQALQQFIVHEGNELRSYTVEQGNATIQSFVDEALLVYNDPDQFSGYLGTAVQEYNRLAALQGLSPEAAAAGRLDLESGVLRAAAVRMANAPGGAQRALDFAAANSGSMNAKDQFALKEVLDPLVIEQTARAWVEGQVVPQWGYALGADPDDATFGSRSQAVIALTTDAYAINLRLRVESGGRLDAENPDTSAAGPYQIIDETWLRHIRSVQQRGGLPDTVGMSDEELLGLRTTSREANDEVFADLREYNRGVLRRAGLPVNSVTEHMLHWWGEGGGVRMLRADPSTPVSDVAGARAAAINGQTGRTVGQMMDWSAGRLGAPTGPQAPNVSEVDLVGAYERILELPPEAREQAMRQLNTLLAAQGSAQRLAQEAAQEEAYEGIMNGTLDVNNLPVELRQRLGDAGMAALMAAVRLREDGVTLEKLYVDLLDMAVELPEAFRQVNLEFYREQGLASGDYRYLKELQRDIRERAGATERMTEAVESIKAFNEVAPLFKNIVGFDPKGDRLWAGQREQVAEFRRVLTRRLQDYVRERGVQPGQAAVEAIAYELLTPLDILAMRRGEMADVGDVFLFDTNRVLEPGQFPGLQRTAHADIPADIRNELDALAVSLYSDDARARVRRRRVETLYQVYQMQQDGVLGELTPYIDLDYILDDPLVGPAVTVLPGEAREGGTQGPPRYQVEGEQGRSVVLSGEGLRSAFIDFLTDKLRGRGLLQ